MERDRERADEQELDIFVRKLHKEVAKVFVERTERHRRPVGALRSGKFGLGFSTGRMWEVAFVQAPRPARQVATSWRDARPPWSCPTGRQTVRRQV